MKLSEYVRFRQTLLDEAQELGIPIDGMAALPRDMAATVEGRKPIDAVSPAQSEPVPAQDPALLHMWSAAPSSVKDLTRRVTMVCQQCSRIGLQRLDETRVWAILGLPEGSANVPPTLAGSDRGLRVILNKQFRLHGWKYNPHYGCYNWVTYAPNIAIPRPDALQ